jgi:hypothetical protein
MRRLAFAVVTAVLALTSALGGATSSGGTSTRAPSKVAVIVLENRSYEQIIGNPHAPYLNSLARRGALATNYYAITHPSLPNYLALTTGGHTGINTDCANCQSESRSLVNQLDAEHISWRAYFENKPKQLTSPYVKGQAYNRHYNPFVYTESINARDAGSDSTDFRGLARDLSAGTLPQFSWIAPNIWHDGHTASLAAADRYAAQLVPRVLHALGPRGLLLVTWDEGRTADRSGAHGAGGGHVPLIALGPAARAGARVSVRANHYALLKTIESRFGLSHLGHARDASTPLLSRLFRS